VESIIGKSVSGETGSVFVTPQLFERITSSERNLIAIDTPRGADVLEQFRQFSVRSGNSIYAWAETGGLSSLRESGMSVSGSTRLPDALRYVQGGLHFGVFLFLELNAHIRFSPARAQVLALLRQIARGRGSGGAARKIVLIDVHVTLSEGIDEMMERIADEPLGPRRIRLRDGRWIV
jgi:hypothetical protein